MKQTKQEYLSNLSYHRTLHNTVNTDNEILAVKGDIARMNKYFYYYPQASFQAFWIQWGNTLSVSKKQARVLYGD